MSGPGLNQSFQQRQTQQLMLAPQMRQSLKILQVAALEEMPMDDVSLEKNATSGDENSGPNDDPREEMDFSKDQQMLERIGQDWRDHMSDTGGVRQTTSEEDERRQHFYDSLTTETSLQQHLMTQAELAEVSPKVLEALRYLIGSLDD